MTARTEEFWTLANYLTLFRIAAIPLVAVFLLFYPGKWPSLAAALIFFLGGVSDVLDGYLARRRNTVSNMGKLLDPLADKLLVGISLILMIPLGYVSAWIVAVIIGRELAMTTLRGVAVAQGIIIAAEPLGKIKAIVQLAATNLLILHYPYFSIPIHELGTYLLWIALALTIWSGADYFIRYLKNA